MIHRYDFGTPWTTDAVVKPVPAEDAGGLTLFRVERRDGAVSLTKALSGDEMIFGLGEMMRGINKRGYVYRAWNSDDFNHVEGKSSLYASHNFLIFWAEDGCTGVYVDDPGEVVFDLGFTDGDTAVITSLNGDFALYVIEGEDAPDIVRQFRRLTGESYLPPRWALGYIQSRWGYASEEELKTVLAAFRANGLPIDGLSMDIDYMDGYRDFSWNRAAFPDLKRLSREMAAEGVHLVPIIDAGIRVDPGDPVYDSGKAADVFCRKADGEDFVGAVWPGHAVFPDFLRADVRAWWAEQHRPLLEAGFTAYWDDMNEPAIFYSDEGMADAYAKLDALRGRNLDVDENWELQGAVNGLANSRADYARFFHTLDGKTVRHDRVHNLYGAHMTMASAEALRRFEPGKRHLLFSRSSFIGAHRAGGVWTGDNSSWWSHILLNLRMLPSLNMCGFLFSGADLGGFSGDTTEDLLLRWLQLGVFTPLMRNHSALHTREQEPYRFPKRVRQMADTIGVRYALIPYLYSELVKAAKTDGMLFRPLAFEYPADALACRVEDQLMWGGDCMIAPVYEQNARGRHVYLPEDMLLVRFRSREDFDLVPMRAGHHWVELALGEFPLFIRRGHAIPLARKAARNTAELDDRDLLLLGWLDGGTEIGLYTDDGETAAIDMAAGTRALHVSLRDGEARCEDADASRVLTGTQEGSLCPWTD